MAGFVHLTIFLWILSWKFSNFILQKDLLLDRSGSSWDQYVLDDKLVLQGSSTSLESQQENTNTANCAIRGGITTKEWSVTTETQRRSKMMRRLLSRLYLTDPFPIHFYSSLTEVSSCVSDDQCWCLTALHDTQPHRHPTGLIWPFFLSKACNFTFFLHNFSLCHLLSHLEIYGLGTLGWNCRNVYSFLATHNLC